MDTSHLDQKLDAMAEPLPHAVVVESQRIADATMPARLRRGRAPRARWLVPAIVTGTIVLTAGAGTAALTMAHWGQVSMPIGSIRNSVPIPLTWTTETGHTEECRAWIEIRNPLPGDQDSLDEAITDYDWTGLGQQIYDSTEPIVEDPDGESQVFAGIKPVMQVVVTEALPELSWLGGNASADERAVDAWGMRCVPETT